MKSPHPRFILTCSVATLITAAAAPSARAQGVINDSWVGTTSSDWNTAANWDYGNVPDNTNTGTFPGGVDAIVDTNTGNIATITTNVPSPRDLRVGETAGTTGQVDLTAGSIGTNGWGFVGIFGATGTLNIADTTTTGTGLTGYGLGSGSFNGGGRFYIAGQQDVGQSAGFGNAGTGTLNVNTTGTITTASDLDVAVGGTGTTGTLNMDAGTINRTGGWGLIAGDNGITNGGGSKGTWNQRGGSYSGVGDTFIGRGSDASGTPSTGVVNLTGGSFNAVDDNNTANNPPPNGNLQFGFGNGIGTLNMSGADTVVSTTHNFILANGGTSQGTANMNGGTMTIGNEMWIGGSSHADNEFNLNGGAVTVNSWVAIGRFGGTGTLNINGGSFTKNDSGDNYFSVGAGTDSTNVATVNLNTGGTLVVPKLITEGGTATFNFNGGVLRANADGTRSTNTQGNDTTFFQDYTTANVRGNGTAGSGANIDSNGFNITVAQPLIHSTVTGDPAVDGGLTKLGTGTLTLASVNNYTGPTVVSVGTLALGPGATLPNTSEIRVAAGAIFDASATGTTFAPGATTLTGTGTITAGPNALTVTGILAPGVTAAAGSFGTLTLGTTGTLTLNGTTQFDLFSNTQKDLITTTGLASLTLGGTLALNATGAAPGTYALINGLTAAPTGTFANVTGVPGNERATFTYANGTYNLVLAAVPEPSTWAMGVFGIGMAAVWLRRRRVVCGQVQTVSF